MRLPSAMHGTTRAPETMCAALARHEGTGGRGHPRRATRPRATPCREVHREQPRLLRRTRLKLSRTLTARPVRRLGGNGPAASAPRASLALSLRTLSGRLSSPTL